MSTDDTDKLHSLIYRAYDTVTVDETKQVYDEWADTYEKDVDTIYNGPPLMARRMNDIGIGKSAHILDAGCGTGLIGLELSRYGFDNIDGVDLSQRSVDKAREKGVYKKLICAELGPEPLKGTEKDTYDAIVSAGCFCGGCHLNDKCLIEWTRIVKPGGIICIMLTEKYLYLLEGDTLKRLLEDKVIEIITKEVQEGYTDYNPGYFYQFKVIKN